MCMYFHITQPLGYHVSRKGPTWYIHKNAHGFIFLCICLLSYHLLLVYPVILWPIYSPEVTSIRMIVRWGALVGWVDWCDEGAGGCWSVPINVGLSNHYYQKMIQVPIPGTWWIFSPKARDAGCGPLTFIGCHPEQAVKQAIELPVMWDAKTLLWRHYNVVSVLPQTLNAN